MIRRIPRLAFSGLAVAWVLSAAVCGPRILALDLRGGAARVDLTPPIEWGVALGGYGERLNRPAEGVHDRVFAKAVVLSGGDKRFAFVTLDVLGLSPAVKRRVLEKLAPDGWSSEQILLLASHTHASYDLGALEPRNDLGIPQIGLFDRRALEHLVGRVVEVIRNAARDPKPVAVGSESATVENLSRRRRPGTQVTDPELTVTRIDTTDGKPLAVLVNWTAHPTFFGARHMLFSGGWPGYLQRELEGWIGSEVTVLYYNGAQGDQSPVAPRGSGSSAYERAEAYGRTLAIAAMELYRDARVRREARFEYAWSPVHLPRPVAHPDFLRTGGAEYGLGGGKMDAFLAKLTVPETQVAALRLGGLLVVGIPGELECALGLDLKRRLREGGIAHPVIGGLANEWVSYMLSPGEYEKGGYEASVSFYGPGLGPTVVEAASAVAAAVSGAD